MSQTHQRRPFTTVCVASLLVAGLGTAAAPSAEQLAELARQIEDSINVGDGSFFNDRFDVDAMLDRVVARTESPPEFERGFRRGFRQNPQQQLGTALATAMASGGSYTFLRSREAPPRLLFRMASEAGLNYHELHLATLPDGTLGFDDVYIYLSGETYSETLRRMYVGVLAEQQRGVVERLLGFGKEYVDHLPQIQKIYEGIQAGRHAQALRIYHNLPASLKVRKELLIARLQAAIGVGDDELVQASEAFRKAFPDDPALDLVLIDLMFIQQRWKQLFATLDRLDRRLGGDPYLDVFRANAYAEAGQPGKARDVLVSMLEGAPDLEDGWAALLGAALAAGDFELVARTLTRLEVDFGYEWPDLSDLEDFDPFTASPAYERWLQRPR